MNFRHLRFTLIAAACISATVASHAASSWTFTGASGGNAVVGGTPGVTASGVYAANGGTFTNNANAQYGIQGFAAGATWTAGSNAALTYYAPSGAAPNPQNGLGMSSDGSTSPDHAIDNGPAYNGSGATGLGNTEAVLLTFGSSIVLNSITTGFVSGDSDFSLFEWTGGSSPTLANASVSVTSDTSTGWKLVGNYDGTGGGLGIGVDGAGGTTAVNTGGASSSWWLISAYNSSYGSTCANCAITGGSILQGNDYFKLYQVAGTVAPIAPAPEPSSIALVGVALFGVVAARRRLERKPESPRVIAG